MPGAGPLLRDDFPLLYRNLLPYIRELIGPDTWTEDDQQWERYFRLTESKRMKEQWILWGGFGLFKEMAENDQVTYDAMVQGPSATALHTQYGLGYQIGFLAAQQDLKGLVARYAPELGRSMRMSIKSLAAAWWGGIFTTSLTADGLSYANASHTFVRGGGTWPNRSATDAALGQTSIETGLIQFMKSKDPMGNPMPMMAETLLIPPDLQPLAHEVLQSRLRYDTATNADNWLNGKLSIETWSWLPISTAWHVLGPAKDRQVYWLWNVHPMTSHGFDFDKHAAKTKTLFVCSQIALDGRGSWCSKGAA